MNMIGHRYKCININPGIMSWQFFPHRFNHPPSIVQPHLVIDKLPKEAFSVLRADGNEIRPGLAVIVPTEPDGSAVGFFWIRPHAARLPSKRKVPKYQSTKEGRLATAPEPNVGERERRLKEPVHGKHAGVRAAVEVAPTEQGAG